jgi:pyruvate kinase
MPRTKIVCTIGPATASAAMLRELVSAGMNVARLNFSHGTHEEHGSVLATLRELAAELERPVAVLQDLAGPKIRIGTILDGRVELETGQPFLLTTRDVPGDVRQASVTYRDLPQYLRPGDTLSLSDGTPILTVAEVADEDIRCRVTVGGPLSSRKGLSLADRSIPAPILTEKDRVDLAFGVSHGVDFVALSFVRTARDIEEVRNLVRESSAEIPLIAKIEQREAIDHIDAILQAADGIMIARGDLGVETPLERVPCVQKMIIAKANAAAKPVITATQMLRSMVESSLPTRAEVSDVANAVLDGSDAIMLSEETAVGAHPVTALRMMRKISASAEDCLPFASWHTRSGEHAGLSPEEGIAYAACRLAEQLGAAAIITFTKSGSTTRLVAKYRPAPPILALTPDPETYRRLALVWGAVPVRTDPVENPEEMELRAVDHALRSGLVAKGQKVVITGGLPLHVAGTTNLIKIADVD